MENLKDVLSLKRDSDNLNDCVKRFNEYIKSKNGCDKYAIGFNLDDRFRALESHTVSLDSWTGFYGSSSSSTYLPDIHNEGLFWKFFDEYININKADLLNYISQRMGDELSKNSDIIKTRIDELNSLLQEITK